MSLALVALAIVVIGVVVASSARRVLTARAETARIRTLFSRYVSPPIVDEIIERGDPRIFAARSGYATILVCRIWNYALFAEKLDAAEMLRYLNEFYALVGKTVQKHRGMIDKFLADGMTGAFGFPIEDPLQEEHAIRAALDIIRLVDAMNVRWTQQGRAPFRVGIGINSGQVIAGDVGFPQRREYSVIGVPALIASRLQEQTETVRAYVLVTQATIEPVQHIFSTLPCKTIPLRGMKGNVRAHIIRGLARNVEENDLLLPPPASFTRTTVEATTDEDLWAEEPAPAAAPAPPPVPDAKARPKRSEDPPSPPEPPSITAKRTRPVQKATSRIEIPESKGFRAIDDSPAVPDPPRVQEYYEDDSGGPPLKLPP